MTVDSDPVWSSGPQEGPSSHSVDLDPGDHELGLSLAAGVDATGEGSARLVASIAVPEPGAPWLAAVGAALLLAAAPSCRRRLVSPVAPGRVPEGR